MNTKLMLRKLAQRFPKRYAKMNHDFVGLMCGKLPSDVHKIFLCLDCDWEVFPLIKKEKPDIVITHHPFIYGTTGWVLSHYPSKKELYDSLESLNIPVYSFHTNFDTGNGGMNDTLAAALELEDIQVVEGSMMMRGGKLKTPMKAEEFALYAKNKLNVDYSLLINYGSPVIKSAAIIGGAGSGNYPIAKKAGFDIFISGDAPHHVRRDIVNDKYNYLDMPHEIEKIFMPTMKKILLDLDDSLEIITVDHEKLPKVIC